MAAETWQHMRDPRRLHPGRPLIDRDSEDVVERAISELILERSPMNEGHAGLRLHVLASLIAQAEALVPDAVADARERDFYWSEIAAELGTTESTSRHRFGDYARKRSVPIEPD